MAFKFSANKIKTPALFDTDHDPMHISGVNFKVTSVSESISEATEWRIKETSVNLIVHTAGNIGSIESEFDGRAFRLDPPSIGEIWLVPSEIEYASLVKGDSVNYLEIVLNQELLAETADDPSKLIELKPVAGGFDSVLFNYFQLLISLQDRKDDVSVIERDHLIRQIANRVSTRFSVDKESPSRRNIVFEPEDVRKIQEFIFEDMSHQIRLDDLCELVGETPHRFLWAFNNAFHTSPAQYIIAVRLRRARYLLLQTRKDITSIAMETGFSDHSHLTTMFRKHTGLAPSEFRQKFAIASP